MEWSKARNLLRAIYMTDENHLVVTIADVSGKGVSAALYMMHTKTTLKICVKTAISVI